MSSKEMSDVPGGEKKKRRTAKVEKSVIDIPAVSTPETTVRSKVSASLDGKQPNRALFYYEENEEVNERDCAEDLELHRNVCNELRSIMSRIKKLKDTGRDDVAEEIEQLRIHGALQFVSLKKLNRIGHFRSKKVREVTNESKLKIDQHHLRLQNLLYEVMHLQKEITKCLQFKSKDEEISLISIDDFYKTAPPEISKPKTTSHDNHQLTLARLNWEMEQRKNLSEKLKESETQKDLLLTEIRSQKEYLDSLQPKLKTIIHVTKPVQDYLLMPIDEIRDQLQTASFLPEPLYIVYMQAKAYGESSDKFLSASIQGDVEAVGAVVETPLEIDDESDSEDEQEKTKNKRHRRNTLDSRLARKQETILRKHPLSICLLITCKDKSVLSLTFYYLVSLKIVTVSVKLTPGPDTQSSTISGGDLLNPENVLCCLFADDIGDRSPNPGNNFSLQRLGMGDFSCYVKEVGHPYLWVQQLCGLQFLVEDSKLHKSQLPLQASHVEASVRRLRDRIRVRLSLQKQLAALEHGTVPLSSEYVALFPAKIASRLVQWKRSTYEDFALCAYTQRMVSCELVTPSHLFFCGIIERKSATLTFQVALSADHPLSTPIFALLLRSKTERTALNDEGIREMEAEVNIHCKELVEGQGQGHRSADQILIVQIETILMCLDVYLETEIDREGSNEFTKEKIFPRHTMGPSRAKPYKYHAQLGFFSQR